MRLLFRLAGEKIDFIGLTAIWLPETSSSPCFSGYFLWLRHAISWFSWPHFQAALQHALRAQHTRSNKTTIIPSWKLTNLFFCPDLAAFGLEKPATDFDSVCLDRNTIWCRYCWCYGLLCPPEQCEHKLSGSGWQFVPAGYVYREHGDDYRSEYRDRAWRNEFEMASTFIS